MTLNRILIQAGAASVVALMASVASAGNIAAGKEKATALCASCHGADGVTRLGQLPQQRGPQHVVVAVEPVAAAGLARCEGAVARLPHAQGWYGDAAEGRDGADPVLR